MPLPNQEFAFRSQRRVAPRPGFTLTELLVVVTIIAILASLVTAGAMNALNAAKRARIALEAKEIERSLLTLKDDFGAFPPNLMNDGSNNLQGNPVSNLVSSDIQRAFKKVFPRHREPPEVLAGLVGIGSGSSTLAGGMNGAEAVYFWLGGFSKDEQYPISGPGGPSFLVNDVEVIEDRNRVYEFDLTRLRPRTGNGVFDDSPGNGRYIEYSVNRNGTTQNRRINFWQYAPSGSQQPYVYFDASRHKPADYDLDISGGNGIFAVKQYRQGFNTSSAPTRDDIVFANNGKFQVLHAGLDDIWGDGFQGFSIQNGADTLTFPQGPFTGDLADTLTNFTTGTLEDAQE